MSSRLKLAGVTAFCLCMAVSTFVPAFARDIERQTHVDGGGGGGGRIDMPRDDDPLPQTESPTEPGEQAAPNNTTSNGEGTLGSLHASPGTTNAPDNSDADPVGLRDYVANKGGRLGAAQRDVVLEAHGICRWLDNLSAATEYFVPIATASEWQAFIDNAPSSVVRDNCCPSRSVNLAATDGQSRRFTLPVGREGATDARGQQTFTHTFMLAASSEAISETYICQAGAWVGQGANILSTATEAAPPPASGTCAQANVSVAGLTVDTAFRKIGTNTYRYGTIGDNYWNGRCARYDRTVTVNVADLSSVREFKLSGLHWDDYIRVKVNGTEVANLPYNHVGQVRGNRIVLQDDTTKTCELSKNWSYTLPLTANGMTEYGSGAGGGRNKGFVVAGDLRPYLVEGVNTIDISVHVWDAGEGFVDFFIDAGASDVPVCGESTPVEVVDAEPETPSCRYVNEVITHDIDHDTCVGPGTSNYGDLVQFAQDYNEAGQPGDITCDAANVGRVFEQHFVTGSSFCPQFTLNPGVTTSECQLVCR